MKGVYLGACKAFLPGYDLDYNDIIDLCNKLGIFIYEYCRHTYFSNMLLNLNGIPQVKDNIQYKSGLVREGGFNVNIVFEYFIKYIS